jgi:hypothetical protein
MRFVSLLAAGALTVPAFAQLAAVAPNGFAPILGNSNNAYPWNQGTQSTRCQFVYDSTNFTLQGINAPVLINRLRYRPASTTGSWAGGSWPNVRIDLATCPVDYLAISSVYASNVGPDLTTVHQGQVVVQAGTGSGPNNWHIDIQLATPFPYDPNGGDLTVDIQLDGTGWTGTSTQADHVQLPGSPPPLGSRVFNTTGASPATGNVGTNYVAVCEFGYALAGGGPVATNTVLGQGCVRRFTSFYESFTTPAAFDLTGLGVTMIPSAGGYIVTPGAAFLPVGSVQSPPTALVLGDDAEVTVPFTTGSFLGLSGPWTGLNVISNGVVSQATGNSLVAAPSIGTLLGNPQTGFYTQADWDPSAGGNVWIEQSAGVTTVTWQNVPSWNVAASQNTFQMQFYASGLVGLAWGAMASTGANGGILVGYSPGGVSADPGNTDISALTGVLVLDTSDTLPLRLAGATRPVVNTSWNLNTTNVPAGGTIGIDIFGLSDPNVVDLGFLGAPGCGARASLDLLNAWIVAGTSHAYSLAIPNDPALVNFHVFTQSAVLQPGVNTLLGGVITSNGIDGKIGSQ